MKNAMTQSDSIRKAAILVSLLDSRSADALLEPMEPEVADQVRMAVMNLDSVSAAEEEQVLGEFFGRGEGDAADGVQLELSLQPANTPTESTVGTASPFSFLSAVNPSMLADVLSRELPQTVAVVVSHLPAEQAGQVLERLPAAAASEALSRMAWLTLPLPDVLADLESELRRRLLPHGRALAAAPASLAGVKAILETLPSQTRAELIDRLAREDERLVRGLNAPPAADATPSANSVEVPPSIPMSAAPRKGASAVPLLEFEDLSNLPDGDLARVAAAATVPLLALALIEADERLSRRLLQVLPRSEAAEVRRRLKQPGPLRLKEIEQAQCRLAEIARQLALRGHITIPLLRHFAAAA